MLEDRKETQVRYKVSTIREQNSSCRQQNTATANSPGFFHSTPNSVNILTFSSSKEQGFPSRNNKCSFLIAAMNTPRRRYSFLSGTLVPFFHSLINLFTLQCPYVSLKLTRIGNCLSNWHAGGAFWVLGWRTCPQSKLMELSLSIFSSVTGVFCLYCCLLKYKV